MLRAEIMYRALRATREIRIPRNTNDAKLDMLETVPHEIAGAILEKTPLPPVQLMILPSGQTSQMDELPMNIRIDDANFDFAFPIVWTRGQDVLLDKTGKSVNTSFDELHITTGHHSECLVKNLASLFHRVMNRIHGEHVGLQPGDLNPYTLPDEFQWETFRVTIDDMDATGGARSVKSCSVTLRLGPSVVATFRVIFHATQLIDGLWPGNVSSSQVKISLRALGIRSLVDQLEITRPTRDTFGNVSVTKTINGRDTGEGVRWSADKSTAYRLHDGQIVEEISLQDASAIEHRLGLTPLS